MRNIVRMPLNVDLISISAEIHATEPLHLSDFPVFQLKILSAF